MCDLTLTLSVLLSVPNFVSFQQNLPFWFDNAEINYEGTDRNPYHICVTHFASLAFSS